MMSLRRQRSLTALSGVLFVGRFLGFAWIVAAGLVLARGRG